MKLTINQVFDAHQVLANIINEKRTLSQKGAYRVKRMYDRLNAEFPLISAKRDELLREHATPAEGENNYRVTPEFVAAWNDFAKDEIEVAVEPIPLAQLDLGDDTAASVRVDELIVLGDLVVE